eukprot:jgi/Botrbrau1/4864/Bobra.0032s0021.1
MSGKNAALEPGFEQREVTNEEEIPTRTNPQDDLIVLRSNWKFCSIIQFCRIFREILGLKRFSADLLESALLNPDAYRVFLGELLYKLLRRDLTQQFNEKHLELWGDLLLKRLARRWKSYFAQRPLENGDFFSVDTGTRIEIIHALCEWRVEECAEIQDYIRQAAEGVELSADLLRNAPIGQDSRGGKYFFFSTTEDCRLYREEPLNKGKGGRSDYDEASWETVCVSIEDISEFIGQLTSSRGKAEKQLAETLSANILPRLIESTGARRRAEEKAAAIEAAPRKRSSRQQVLAIKQEEEIRRKAQEVEDRQRAQKEQETKRRENRYIRGRDEEARRSLLAAELCEKAMGVNDGPSRDERMARRGHASGALEDNLIRGMDGLGSSGRGSPPLLLDTRRASAGGSQGYPMRGMALPQNDNLMRFEDLDDFLGPANAQRDQEELDILFDLGGLEPTSPTQLQRQSQRTRPQGRARATMSPEILASRGKREAEGPAGGHGLLHPKRQRTESRRVPRSQLGAILERLGDGHEGVQTTGGHPVGRGGQQRQGKVTDKGRGKERAPTPEEERSNTPNFLQVKLRSNRRTKLSTKLKDSIIAEDLDGSDEDEYVPERERSKKSRGQAAPRGSTRTPDRQLLGSSRVDMKQETYEQLQREHAKAFEQFQAAREQMRRNMEVLSMQYKAASTPQEKMRYHQMGLAMKEKLKGVYDNVQRVERQLKMMQMHSGTSQDMLQRHPHMQAQMSGGMQSTMMARPQGESQQVHKDARTPISPHMDARSQVLKQLLHNLPPHEMQRFQMMPSDDKRKFVQQLLGKYEAEQRARYAVKMQQAGVMMQPGGPVGGLMGGQVPMQGHPQPLHMAVPQQVSSHAVPTGGPSPLGGPVVVLPSVPVQQQQQQPSLQQQQQQHSQQQYLLQQQQQLQRAQQEELRQLLMANPQRLQYYQSLTQAEKVRYGQMMLQQHMQKRQQEQQPQQQQQQQQQMLLLKKQQMQQQHYLQEVQAQSNLMGQGSGGPSRSPQQSPGFPGMSNPMAGHSPRLGPGSTSPVIGNTLAGFPSQGTRSPILQAQLARSSAPPLQAPISPMMHAQMLMAARSGPGVAIPTTHSGLQMTGSGSGLLPAHPGSGNFASRTPGNASPAPGTSTPRGGSATMTGNAVPLGAQLPPSTAADAPRCVPLGTVPTVLPSQLSAEALRGRSLTPNPQGPPRPLSPPAAHQTLTSQHDDVATLLAPLPSEHPPQALTPPPARGRSGGPRVQSAAKTSSGSRTPPPSQLSPTPLSSHQPTVWDTQWQGGGARPGTPGEHTSPLPGEHLTLRIGSDAARGSTPPSPLHAQLSPRVAGPPITTGVAGLGASPSDLLGRSTPPPGAAAVTTGVTRVTRPPLSPMHDFSLGASGSGALAPMSPLSGTASIVERAVLRTSGGSDPSLGLRTSFSDTSQNAAQQAPNVRIETSLSAGVISLVSGSGMGPADSALSEAAGTSGEPQASAALASGDMPPTSTAEAGPGAPAGGLSVSLQSVTAPGSSGMEVPAPSTGKDTAFVFGRTAGLQGDTANQPAPATSQRSSLVQIGASSIQEHPGRRVSELEPSFVSPTRVTSLELRNYGPDDAGDLADMADMFLAESDKEGEDGPPTSAPEFSGPPPTGLAAAPPSVAAPTGLAVPDAQKTAEAGGSEGAASGGKPSQAPVPDGHEAAAVSQSLSGPAPQGSQNGRTEEDPSAPKHPERLVGQQGGALVDEAVVGVVEEQLPADQKSGESNPATPQNGSVA